jgi:hypothetical protein
MTLLRWGAALRASKSTALPASGTGTSLRRMTFQTPICTQRFGAVYCLMIRLWPIDRTQPTRRLKPKSFLAGC